jgi:exodeoxyribonuclease V beta subunit
LAVLTRTNRQAQDVQAKLRKLGIPAVMHGDRSVFESPEALELRRVLRALAEPGHRQLARTALCTRLVGLDADALLALDDDHDELEKWTARLRTWGQLWQTRGIAHAVEALSAETDLLKRTLGDRDGERRMTNFRHLLELLHESQTKEHLGVAGLLRHLDGAIADPAGHAMAVEARQLRLESDADAVTLTTAHKSKGLEYDVVFLQEFTDQSLHRRTPRGRRAARGAHDPRHSANGRRAPRAGRKIHAHSEHLL